MTDNEIAEIIRSGTGSVVDVRTPGEFMGGHVYGSINVPLDELTERMEELGNLEEPLILCCASGNRSGMACEMLSRQGFNCINGGPWLNVNYWRNNPV